MIKRMILYRIRSHLNLSLDELRHNLLAWLSDLDFAKDHERIHSRRHEDTGNWLVDSSEFQDWENSKTSSLLGVTELVRHLSSLPVDNTIT